MNEKYELAIVGAGPAGLAAASTAAAHGLKTVLFDEQPEPGGQIYRSIEQVALGSPDRMCLLGDSYRYGETLVAAFRGSSAEYSPSSKVWNLTGDGELSVAGPRGGEIIRADRVLIAVGAMERPMPIPGWTLPGVQGAGSAQILMKAAGLVPDVPVVIAGSGPLLFLVAWQLVKADVPVRAILETTPRSNYLRALKHAPGVVARFGAVWQGLQWIRSLKCRGVAVISGVNELSALGSDRLQKIRYSTSKEADQTIDCGMLLLHQGVVPNYHLAKLAGAEQHWDEAQKSWRTSKDRWGATSLDSIGVAGDCVGIGGAIVAEHQGRLAGLDAAHRADRITRTERDTKARDSLRELGREARLRGFLDALYEPAPWTMVPPADSTIVCRCEEVTAGDIREVVRLGAVGTNQVKSLTRAGMGPCQGRMCGLTVASIIAAERRVSVGEAGAARVRPPIKPITLGELTATRPAPADPEAMRN